MAFVNKDNSFNPFGTYIFYYTINMASKNIRKFPIDLFSIGLQIRNIVYHENVFRREMLTFLLNM